MFVQDAQGNWLDGDINISTNMEVDVEGNIDTGYDAVPFDHSARLGDKLFGAVGVALDNVQSGIQVQNMKNNATYQNMQGQTSVVPFPLARWIQKNILLLVISVFFLFFFGIIKR